MNFLESLSNADAIAGNEQEIRDLMRKNMKADNEFCDNLGGIVFEKKGNGPKVLLAAHMDEVGFMVRSITDMGQVIVKTIGGVKPTAKHYQSVRITTNKGKKIKGYLETISGDPDITYVDLGLDNKKQVEKLGIEAGNMVTYNSEFYKLEGRDAYCGKAMDDRVGIYVMSKVLENIKNKKLKCNAYFGGSVAEEVGTRGAQTIAHKVNPDVAFVIDTCCYKDEFDRGHNNKRQIGKGLIVTLSDKRYESNRYLVELIKKTAKKLKVDLQLDMFDRGSTDASKFHLDRDGVPTLACCVPLRYGHCSHSIVDKKDIDNTIKIYTEILIHFDNNDYKKCIAF